MGALNPCRSAVAIAIAAIALAVSAACAGPASTAPTTPSQAPPASGIAASRSSTIGLPADDGARVTAVDRIDSRIRDLTIDSPAVGRQSVRLLVPDGFDEQPSTSWPVLYLLHGAFGSSRDWTQMTDVEALAASARIIVVMPDGGERGFYSDWWNDGNGGPPMWETFHLVELPQLLERNWRTNHRWAVAGTSMGGLGAILYTVRQPDRFLAAASFSGVLDPIGGQIELETDDLWGDPIKQADVWEAHSPLEQADELPGRPLYVSYGDGGAGPLDGGSVPSDDLEPWIAQQNETFIDRLNELDMAVTVDAYGAGSHSWAYWERALHRSFPLLMAELAP